MKSLTLRLDDELYEQLKQLAKDNDRSINNSIVQAIKKYIKENG